MTEEEVQTWIEENGVGDRISIMEMIKIAKNSENGCVWYTPNGPVAITKDGKIGWYGRELD